jgi:hypothetical protein
MNEVINTTLSVNALLVSDKNTMEELKQFDVEKGDFDSFRTNNMYLQMNDVVINVNNKLTLIENLKTVETLFDFEETNVSSNELSCDIIEFTGDNYPTMKSFVELKQKQMPGSCTLIDGRIIKKGDALVIVNNISIIINSEEFKSLIN